jgi:LacI family transcriptional regulator
VASLAALGHHSIACITGPAEESRRRDFLAAMTASGLQPPPGLTLASQALTTDEGMRCCRRLLADGPACTAIITTSDLLAAGCCQALTTAGRSCPEDISVTGHGDLPLAGSLTPPLTTLRLPHYEMGTRAAKLVLDRITGARVPPAALLLPPELIVRGSTASAP